MLLIEDTTGSFHEVTGRTLHTMSTFGSMCVAISTPSGHSATLTPALTEDQANFALQNLIDYIGARSSVRVLHRSAWFNLPAIELKLAENAKYERIIKEQGPKNSYEEKAGEDQNHVD